MRDVSATQLNYMNEVMNSPFSQNQSNQKIQRLVAQNPDLEVVISPLLKEKAEELKKLVRPGVSCPKPHNHMMTQMEKQTSFTNYFY